MSKLETSAFKRNFITVICLGISLTVIPLTCIAADSERPELNGTWTNQSITRLNRPDDSPLVVTAEQAQLTAAAAPIHGRPPGWIDELDPDTGAPKAGSRDFGLFSYNQFWFDQGASLARVKGEYRSSFVVDPENGQVPWLEKPDTRVGIVAGALTRKNVMKSQPV